MTYEQLTRLGKLIDKAENLIAASHLPLPDATHAKCLREGLHEIRDEVRDLYRELGGDE